MQLRWPIWLSHFVQWPMNLPSQCLACHAWPSSGVLCHDCLTRFHQRHTRCTGCALALPGLSAQHPRCGACLRRPPLWQSAAVGVDYSYPWNQLITRWKFAQQPALAKHLAHWMLHDEHIRHAVAQAQVVIPIPLSVQRMRERGYNPAAQLAKHLAPSKYQAHALQRIRHTPAQSDLTRAQRLRNIRGAFAIHANHCELLQGQNVLLVDDVMTTGATLTEASRCLLHAGAAQIHVLCMARTP